MSLSLVNISVSLNNADCHLLLFFRHFSLAHSPSFSPSPHFLSLCPNSFCFLRLSFTLPLSLISSWSSWLQRLPQSPCLFCPHVDQGTLTTSALREFNKFTAMPLWPATMPESLFSTTWPFVFLSHAHSLLPWLSSLQMDRMFRYLVHVGDVGSQVFGTVEQPIRPFYLNSFPHFRSTQVHTISALKYKRVVDGL